MRAVLMTCAVGMAAALPVRAHAQKVYWTEPELGRIRCANADGSGLTTLARGMASPTAPAIDPRDGRLYWRDVLGALWRAEASGAGRVELAGESALWATRLPAPSSRRDVVISTIQNRVFWTDGASMRAVNMDGTGEVTLVVGGVGDLAIQDGVHLFWIEATTVRRSGLDGAGAMIIATEFSPSTPTGLSFHGPSAKIYWWSVRGRPLGGRAWQLKRADLDGSHVELVLDDLDAGGAGLTFDDAAGKLYFHAEDRRYGLYRANFDGSAYETLVPVNVTASAVDVAAQRLWWIDRGSGQLHTAGLDGASPTAVTSVTSDPTALTLDPSGAWLYAGDRERDVLVRIGTNGGSAEPVAISPISTPAGIALDPSRRRLFWSDTVRSAIYSSRLDGTDPRVVATARDRPEKLEVAGGGSLYVLEAGGAALVRVDLDTGAAQAVRSDLRPPGRFDVTMAGNVVHWVEDDAIDGHRIRSAPLDGSGMPVTVVLSTQGIFDNWQQRFRDLAVASDGGRMYWAEHFGLSPVVPRVWAADPSGANQVLLSNLNGRVLDDYQSIDLDERRMRLYWTQEDGIFSATTEGDDVRSALQLLGRYPGGIGQVTVDSSTASCGCEMDGDTTSVDVFDLLAFLDVWFLGAPEADFDGSGAVDVMDLLEYLSCWFGPSRGECL